MIRQHSKQAGITLVEVMLTLAISTMLLVTVLVGNGSIRARAQFSDGMERLKEMVLATKSEANTSNNTTGVGTGDSGLLVAGRLITFKADEKTATTSTVMCPSTSGALRCNRGGAVVLRDTRTIDLPWDITYQSLTADNQPVNAPDLTIMFARDDADGSFTGYWWAGKPSGVTTLDTLFANQAIITLRFKSQTEKFGEVIVNPATGAVDRRVL